MPIDPSIALGLQPSKPIDYLSAYGNALTLKNLMGQQELQGLQLQQARREAEKQMRLSDLARASGGDIDKFLTGMAEVDPIGAYELGMKNRKTLADLAKAGMEGRKLALESADKFSPIYLRAAQFVKSRGYTPEAVAEAKQFMLSSGVPSDLVATVPNTVTPEYVEGVITSNMSFADWLARSKEDFERRYPGEIGKLLYAQEQFRAEQQNPSDVTVGDRATATGENAVTAPTVTTMNAPTPFDAPLNRARFGDENKPFLRNDRGQIVPNEPVQRYELNRAEKSATKVQQFNNPKDNFDNERKLRQEFTSEPIYKAHSEVRSAYGQIGKSLGLKSPAGDLAAATKIMKLLDPGSVVRESELAMAVAAAGLEDRITNFAQNILSGNKLTPKQREDFRKLADELFLISEREYDRVRKEYMDTAKDYNLSPERVGGRTKPSAGAEGKPAPGGRPGLPEKPQFNLNSMPDPKQHSGKVIESQDGVRYKSDGTKWIRQPKGAGGNW